MHNVSFPLPEEKETPLAYFSRWHAAVSPTGLYGINIPSRYGGLELGHWDRFEAISNMARRDTSAGAILQSVTLGVGMFLSAPEHLREEWLPKLATGEEIATICITEPKSGARIGSLESTLLPISGGEAYVLTGSKQFIANAHVGTVHGVFAKNVAPGQSRPRCVGIIVPNNSAGVEAGPIDDLNGLKHFNGGGLRFNNVQIPADHVLLGINGLRLAHRSITLFGKLNLAAVAYGALLRSWDETQSYLSSDTGRTKQLEKLGAIRSLIGEVQRSISASRALCFSAAHSIDKGVPEDDLIVAAKAATVNNAISGILACISIMGARGGSVAAGHVERLSDVVQTMAPAGTESVSNAQLGQFAMGNYKKVGIYGPSNW